ncbi:MAG: recombinase family protein [Cypionkella sp.]|nr:recombinase family protein [Cypionkella sp.]
MVGEATRGQAAEIDTMTSAGRMIFGIFATLAELEYDLIREGATAGLDAARVRWRKGGRKFALTKAQIRLAQAAMANRDTSVAAFAAEPSLKLYRFVDANGNLRDNGKRALSAWRRILHSRASEPSNCHSRTFLTCHGAG